MALHWDFTKIENSDELCYTKAGKDDKDEQLCTVTPETEALLFICMSIGMDGIAEKNFKEFCLRVHMLQQIQGPWMSRKEVKTGNVETYPIDHTHIRAHIGLSVNVGNESKAWFNKKLRSISEQRVAYMLQKAKEEQKGAA